MTSPARVSAPAMAAAVAACTMAASAITMHAISVAGVRICRPRAPRSRPRSLHGRRVVPAALGVGLYIELTVHRVAQLQLRSKHNQTVSYSERHLSCH